MARIGMTARLAPVAVAACVILSAAAHGPASADLLLVDRVVAVVGRRPVLDSDVREGIMAMGYSGAEAMAMADSSPSYVLALEQLVEEKLIVEGAWRLALFHLEAHVLQGGPVIVVSVDVPEANHRHP